MMGEKKLEINFFDWRKERLFDVLDPQIELNFHNSY